MKHVLITGANRGIGLGIARAFAASGYTVYGTARDPQTADDLRAIDGDVRVIALDVTNDDRIAAAVAAVREHTDVLDVLVNNAGVQPPRSQSNLDGLTFEQSLWTLKVNAVAPPIVTRGFLPLLRASDAPKVLMISSQLGSLEIKRSGGILDYCASKAALNMYARGLAGELAPSGVVTIMIHPGHVRTDMGGDSAPLSIDESAAGILQLAQNATQDHNGGFFRWDGTVHPW